MYKILIVEDDGVIASAVAAHLHSWGWETSCVVDFQHVMEAFAAFSPHLVLLDITLPFYDGYHWCAEIPEGVQGAGGVFILGGGQHEHRDGHDAGRGRFYREAF